MNALEKHVVSYLSWTDIRTVSEIFKPRNVMCGITIRLNSLGPVFGKEHRNALRYIDKFVIDRSRIAKFLRIINGRLNRIPYIKENILTIVRCNNIRSVMLSVYPLFYLLNSGKKNIKHKYGTKEFKYMEQMAMIFNSVAIHEKLLETLHGRGILIDDFIIKHKYLNKKRVVLFPLKNQT